MTRSVDLAAAQTGIDYRAEIGSREAVNLETATVCAMKADGETDLSVMAAVQDDHPAWPEYTVGLFVDLSVGTLCPELMSGEMREGQA